MKFFLVEGKIEDPSKMNVGIIGEHKEYAQTVMKQGVVLISTLKEDMSGGVVVIKAESIEKVEEYLAVEPLKVAGIQDYRIIEIVPHYVNSVSMEWFNK